MNLTALNEEQTAHVQAWTAIALQKMPYMASMLFSLRFVNTPGLGTFAVDRHHRCYIDFDAVTDEGPVSGGESLLHECMHLYGADADFADDLGITGGPLAKAWNLAADAAHNDDLRDGGCSIFADGGRYVLPSSLGQPDYQTAQSYFEHLRQAIAKKQAQQQGQKPSNQPGQGQPTNGPGQPAPGAPGAQPGQGGTPGPPGPYKGCGSGSGGEAAPGELDPNSDLGGVAPAATNAEKERVRITTSVAILDAAAKGRGTVPGGLITTAQQVLTPSVIPWQKVLGRLVRGSVRSRIGTMDVSFNRRNRRRHNERILTKTGLGPRIVTPASVDPTPTVKVIRDTSGSMSAADLEAVTSEVVGIAKKLRIRGDDLTITDVDAQAYGTKKFTGAKALGEISGRGGTDMRVGITHALESKPKPTVVVVMTDGDTPWPDQQTRIPVIAVIIGTHRERAIAAVPKWIRTVHVDLAA